MKISKTENNTVTNMVSIWNYIFTDDGTGIISSTKIMDCPVAPWADRYDVEHLLINLAIDSDRWVTPYEG